VPTTDERKKIQSELQRKPVNLDGAKEQSRQLDEVLGFRCAAIEDELFEVHKDQIFSSPKQFWFGLDLQSMQTPYSELVELVDLLRPQTGHLWVDLGAAYGRLGIVLGFRCPQVQFIGFESVAARVVEGNRIFKHWDLKNSQMQEGDLADRQQQLKPAELYFLYDFGSRDDVYVVLKKLEEISRLRAIQVVARGRGVRGWILMDFPWLYDQCPPEHHANWTVFKTLAK